MASDGSVIFSTELDESGLKSALGGISKKAASWSKGAINVLKGTGVALGAVTTGIGALAKTAISYNSSMENYVTNFGVMMGDEAKAVTHVAELREMAAKTPFGMQELADASQTMLSFGLDAEYSMNAMQQLGDISLGNKERFSSLALAFSQVSSAGKLTGQDLLQMVNAGFNPLNTIAEKTGTSLGDLKDVMGGGKGSREFQKQMKAAQKEVKKMGDQASEGAKMLAQIGKDGAISAEMVGLAMEIETSPGGRFYNGMLKASETFSGMVSTLEDDATALVGKVFEPMTDGMTKTLLPMAQRYLQTLSTAFETGGTGGLVTALGGVIGDAVSEAANALPNVLTLSSNLLTAIGDSLTTNADTIMNGLTKAITSIATSGLPETTISTLGTLAQTLLGSLAENLSGNAGTILSGITGGLVTLLSGDFPADVVGSLFRIASSLITGIAVQLPTLLPALAKGIITGIGAAFESLPELASAAGKLLEGLKKGIIGESGDNSVLNQVGQLIIDGLNKFLENAAPKINIKLPDFETIRGDIEKAWAEMRPKVEEIITATLKLDFGQNEPEKVAQKMVEAGAGVETNSEGNVSDTGIGLIDWFYEKYYKHTKEADKRLWELLGIGTAGAAGLPEGAAAEVEQMASTTASAYRESLLVAFQEGQISYEELVAKAFPTDGTGGMGEEGVAGEQASGLASRFVQELASGIEQNGSEVSTSLNTINTQAQESADTSGFSSVGYQIAAGVAQGITSGTGLVSSAIRSLISSALRAAKLAAAIRSPSRLFADEVGAYLSAGTAMGVDKNAWMLRRSIDNMIDQSIPDVSKIASSLVQRPLNFANGSAAAMAAAGTTNQTINFNVPVQTPAEFANTMFLYSTYGLTEA